MASAIFANSNLRIASDSINANNKLFHLFISANFDKGGLLYPTHDYKDQVIEKIYIGSELRIGIQTENGNFYDQLYKYPSFGVGYYYANLTRIKLIDTDSEETFDQGHPSALFGFIKVPIIRRKKVVWSYQFGGGVSFNFKPYDPENNPGNILIGSKLNVYFEVGSSLDYLLSNRFTLSGGYILKHFSNGSARIPNLGINLVAFQCAVRYNFSKSPQFNLNYSKIPELEMKNEIITSIGAGVKMLNEDFDNQKYDNQWFQSTVQVGYMRRVGWKRSWGAGTDFTYKSYGNYLEQMKAEKKEENFEEQSSNNFAMAIWIGHEVRYGKMSVHLQCATYLFNNSVQALESPYYFRIGARYNLYKNALIGINLKSHGTKADIIEYALGYRFGW